MLNEIEIGSLWADGDGHKTIVLAYDPISCQIFVYDYVINYTKFVNIRAIEDGIYKKWDDFIASEKSQFEKEKSRMQIKLWEAFVSAPGRLIQDGSLCAIHIICKDGSESRFAYQEFLVKEEHVKLGKSVLESFLNAACFSANKFTSEQNIDHIVWRTYPEMALSYDCISGQRTLMAYARLVALSKENQVNIPYENQHHHEAKGDA